MYRSPLESHTAGTGTRPFPSSLVIKTSPPHDHHPACNTGLSLGLPGSEDAVDNKLNVRKQTLMSFGHLLPPLSLGLPTSSSNHKNTLHSGWSQHVSEEDEANPRKKLRLTKYQYIVLEDIFKNHANLTPNQKQALAKRLNLQPRQVEVWFQNRRARIKLKQTEAECELLKKCCRRLTEENERLHKELLDLKLTRGVGATTTANAPAHSPVVHIAMPPAAMGPLHLPFLRHQRRPS